MVNTNSNTGSAVSTVVSTKAKVLMSLRGSAGKPISGSILAEAMGISRVAVWKGIQALIEAGYPVEASDAGYTLSPDTGNDFLYPWEFGEKEAIFRYFDNTGSTMDRARECAGTREVVTVITAGKQSAGRGRNGRVWASRLGGLYFTVLNRPYTAEPKMAIADYSLPAMMYHIAIARVLGSVCGKAARLRWPNDIYIGKQKIAGVMTEIGGEGDAINWLAVGIGINANNKVPSEKAVSCAGITGHPVSRRDLLLKILDEAESVKKEFSTGTVYAQGNRLLAAEWNSLADCMGARIAIVSSGSYEPAALKSQPVDSKDRVLAKGIFAGVDPAGRCIIKPESGEGIRYFNPGPVSVVYINNS
ncbi:MAG: biotin--[acetyl-CoA-carboxylase] ligase [Treponema sp.]|nr:biotin--[acetyl-CoA-carboxylase] ligase [Treponema sp.]